LGGVKPRPYISVAGPESSPGGSIRGTITARLGWLWDPGIRIHAAQALDLLGDAGATIDRERNLARIPRELAERCLASAPSSFELYDSEGRVKVRYAGDQVHFDPGSAAIEILDHGATTSRPPVTADFVRFIQLAEGLAPIDAVATSLVCQDVPQSIGDLYRLYLALRFATKPVITGAFGIDSWYVMRELLRPSPAAPRRWRAGRSRCSTSARRRR